MQIQMQKKHPESATPLQPRKPWPGKIAKTFFFLAFLFACFSHALVASFPAFFPSFLQVVDFLE